MDPIALLIGLPLGVIIWWFTLRKMALREDDERRRKLGLPPRKANP